MSHRSKELSVLRRVFMVAGGAFILAWAVWYMWPGPDVYMTSREVSGHFGEKLELNHGEFRYWMYSDVGLASQPQYPLTGTYTLEGDRLTLCHSSLRDDARIRIMDRVKGVHVVWRYDGWALWSERKEIHPYGVMIRSEKPLLPFLRQCQPSLVKISPP